jgi:hypothetical protein
VLAPPAQAVTPIVSAPTITAAAGGRTTSPSVT